MKFLFIIFFILPINLCRGQYEFDYKPLNSSLDDHTEQMLKNIEDRLKYDLKNIHSKHEKQIKKFYSDRTQWLINHIKEQNFIYEPAFIDYVETVLDIILLNNPSIRHKPSRILIDRNPIANALCTGEGTLIINLGMLRRISNESQIAFIVAHELAHYELNHVNRNIATRVEQYYGEQTKEKIKSIRTSGYSRTLRAIELLKGIMYTGVNYSRQFETEADSLSLIFLANTPYDKHESISLLQILDSADFPKYRYQPRIDSIFNFSKYPFKKSWLVQQERIFSRNDNMEFLFNLDSLKTHPDVKTRIEYVIKMLPRDRKETINIQAKDNLEWIITTSDFEVIESAFFLEDYGRCLFLTLQGLSAYHDHTYLHTMIGRIFVKLYEARRDYTFGKYVPAVSKEFNKSLNEINTFLHNLRLSEIGQIALNYMNTKINFNPDCQEHFYLLWKISDLIDDQTAKRQVMEAYKQKFPNGIYNNEILAN